MVNSLSIFHPRASDAPKSLVCQVLEFICEEDVGVDVVKSMFGPVPSLQTLANPLRLPPYFQTDMVTFREIFLAAQTGLGDCSPGDVERLDECTCDKVMAYAERLNQAEKLVSFIVSLVVLQLKRTFKCAVNHDAFLAARSGVALLKSTAMLLRALIYSCAGDPECFPSATTWLRRLDLALLILDSARDHAERTKEEGDAAKPFSTLVGRDLESMSVSLSASLQECLLERGEYDKALELTTLVLCLLPEFYFPLSAKLVALLRLHLARALLGMGRRDEGIAAMVGFVLAARQTDGLLCEAGLVNDQDSPYEDVDLAILYCLDLPEVKADVGVYAVAAQTLLLVAAPPPSSSMDECRGPPKPLARDIILESVVRMLLVQGRIEEACEVGDALCDCRVRIEAIRRIMKRVLAMTGDALDKICARSWREEDQRQIVAILEATADRSPHLFKDQVPLYRWHLASRHYRAAAQLMYRFARENSGEEAYFAMQLCHSCLSLADPDEQWLLLPGSSQVLDLGAVERSLSVVRAQSMLGAEGSSTDDPRHLIFHLLRHLRVEPAISLTLHFPAEWALVTSFLIDSYADGCRGDIDRSWLGDVVRAGFYMLAPSDRTEEPELAVLRHFLASLERSTQAAAFLGVIDRLAAKRMQIPPWLVKHCLEQFDCMVNDLVRVLGNRQYLDLIAEILKDSRVRRHLTAGTMAYLRLLCE